ncbi:MAG: hypothetical protein SRB2_01907 [Desulfobacteraceae bacterium Eth-SRB2]|nr:MAG: hypothetical protein SRB2_01907 [Desulfobacteraceae bacterium Eth-SRB2]
MSLKQNMGNKFRNVFIRLENILEKLNEMKVKPEPDEPDKLLGLFADESELVDHVTESVMQARENDSLRVS